MFLIGLTGGIATGKSTTANIFKEKNIPVVDADVFARLIVQPGQRAWKEIRQIFGTEVFQEDGQLNREVLGKVIFSDVEKRKKLNKITHPKIQRLMFWAIVQHFFDGHHFVLCDIPLLFETGSLLPFLYKIITVTCDQETQVKRLMERNDYSETEAIQRIKAQMPLQEKCDKSDFIVDNSASLSETRTQVEKIIVHLQSSKHHQNVRVYLAMFLFALLFILGLFVFLIFKLSKLSY